MICFLVRQKALCRFPFLPHDLLTCSYLYWGHSKSSKKHQKAITCNNNGGTQKSEGDMWFSDKCCNAT